MNQLYDMFFKRKSFRCFKSKELLSTIELEELQNQFNNLKPLIDNIAIKFRIVKKETTTCKRGEYCLLVYSEIKDYYLLNIGYMLEQMDLWMASKNIGACWYGVGKVDIQQYEGLPFIIMLAFGKGDDKEFRQDYTKAKRKPTIEIWKGDVLKEIGDVIRFSPSACNSQPWIVETNSNLLTVYRNSLKRSLMPESKVTFYNTIDMGIFMCFLEIALFHKNYTFNRLLYEEELDRKSNVKIAQYLLNKSQ